MVETVSITTANATAQNLIVFGAVAAAIVFSFAAALKVCPCDGFCLQPVVGWWSAMAALVSLTVLPYLARGNLNSARDVRGQVGKQDCMGHCRVLSFELRLCSGFYPHCGNTCKGAQGALHAMAQGAWKLLPKIEGR